MSSINQPQDTTDYPSSLKPHLDNVQQFLKEEADDFQAYSDLQKAIARLEQLLGNLPDSPEKLKKEFPHLLGDLMDTTQKVFDHVSEKLLSASPSAPAELEKAARFLAALKKLVAHLHDGLQRQFLLPR